mgnify:FL=1
MAQIIDIKWQMTYGGNGDDRGTAIIQSADSGFVVAGYSNALDGDITSPHGNEDFWVAKLDSIGNFQWQKSYGGSSADFCHAICYGINGGYLLVGQSNSNDGDLTENKGGYDIWVVKISETGDIEWQNNYGGSLSENAKACLQTIDGNYLITGYSLSTDGDITFNHGGADIWVLKLNESGSVVWQKSYGSSESDNSQDIIESPTGDIYVVGNTDGIDGDVTIGYGFDDYWILKLNASGDLIWQKSYGGSDAEIAKEVILKNNGLICVGQTYSDNIYVEGFHGLLDAWVIALDSLGNLQWQKPYGGSGGDEAYSIAKLTDNEFVFSGRSSTTDGDVTENKGGVDYWVVSIDTLGNIIWQKSIGGTSNEESYDVITTFDSTIVVTGYSASSDMDVTADYTGNNYWVVELNECENMYYLDNDNDAYGNLVIDSIACFIPLGFVTNNTDCNDSNNLIYPGTTEICNTLDDNCNYLIDEDIIYATYYIDADGDNFGNAEIDTLWCGTIPGYVTDATDCNDADNTIYPGSEELLNGVDDDCDQLIDEGLSINQIQLVTLFIFPSPTMSEINIQFEVLQQPQLTIRSITGEVIFITKNILSNFTFDASKLAPGVYFIELNDGVNVGGGFFIKN